MKSIYGLEIIANIALNKAISRIGEKIYRLLYKTYFRTLQPIKPVDTRITRKDHKKNQITNINYDQRFYF